MKFIETADMHKLVKTKWTTSLITEAFKLHDIPINMTWADKDKLEEICTKFAVYGGWDSETTLVWYAYPPDFPKEEILDNFDDALKELTKMNSTQCSCLLFQNMTAEKLAELIDQVVNMRAFL